MSLFFNKMFETWLLEKLTISTSYRLYNFKGYKKREFSDLKKMLAKTRVF